MLNLNNKISVFVLFTPIFFGCATSTYKVARTQGQKVEISVTPDRVLVECAKVSDENEFYLFMIHVLDEQKTVLSAVQGNNTNKEGCDEWSAEVNHILSRGKKIYLAGMGDAEEPLEVILDEKYIFPKHGTFYGNGRNLQFMVIANEKGTCMGAYIKPGEPCPGGEFPITD